MTCSCHLSPAPAPAPAPATLDVAERQLVMLRELGQIAMAVSRAFGSSAMAAAEAEKCVLAEEYFVPEVGRARACGAKDAAESFQKASRAVRLTFRLEMAVAETLDDLRAGVATTTAGPKDGGGAPLVEIGFQDRRRLDGSGSDETSLDRDRRDPDAERLIDIERPDSLPRAPFRETVDLICADLSATVDWDAWTVEPKDLQHPARGSTPTETDSPPDPTEPAAREAARSP